MAQVSGPQWAADPYGRYELRFWDGSTWTEHVSRHGVQARDPLAPVAPVVPQQTFDRTVGQEPIGQEPFGQEPFGPEPFAELLPRSSGRSAGVPGHTRQGAGAAKAPRRKGLPVLLAAGAAAAVVALVASLGGQPSTPAASSTTDSIQPLVAVPTQSSSTKARAATPAATATSRTTTTTAAKKKAKTTTTTAGTTTGSRTTTTKARASSTKPRTTSAKPRTTKPRTTTSTKPAAKDYANCTAMHVDYPHGVGRSGAVDHTTGAPPVTDFVRSNALYAANSESDRDGDDIACESH